AVTTYAEDRRSGRKGFQTRAREYRQGLVALKQELEDERRAELAARREAAPAAPDLIARAPRHDPPPWERPPRAPALPELRVGTAELPSLLETRVDQGGNVELRRQLDELTAWYATTPDAPVTIRAAEAGAVGLAGPRERVESVARSLVAQAAALHSPRE